MVVRSITTKAFIVVCLFVFVSYEASATVVGEIVALQGTATLARGSESQSLNKHDLINANDTITTSAESHAQLIFKDGSKLTIGENSDITIDQFIYDHEKTDGTSIIKVEKGFFRFIGGQLKKSKTKIQTPVSTIGIRGTELFAEVKENGITSVGLVECCVDISNDAGTVALEEPGTYSQITSRSAKPGAPIVCDIKWVEKAAEALGITPKDLNY